MGLKRKILFSLSLFVFLVSTFFLPSINNPSVNTIAPSSVYRTPKAEAVVYTPLEMLAIGMANKVFEQNHTEPVYNYTVFRYYENSSVFFLAVYYLVAFNCSEGQFDVTYRRDYIVDVETGRVEDGPINTDVPEGFVIRFTGKEPVTTRERATDTYFLLLQKSPSTHYYILSVDNDRLSLEIFEVDGYYDVIGVFRNFAVNCLDAKILIEYNIFYNGTAILQGATTLVGCGGPEYG